VIITTYGAFNLRLNIIMRKFLLQKNFIIVAASVLLLGGGWIAISMSAENGKAAMQQEEKPTNSDVNQPASPNVSVSQISETSSANNSITDSAQSASETPDSVEDVGQSIIFTHAELSYDPKDTKIMTENKKDIFVGKITQRIKDGGVNANYTWPTFSVEILSVMKGDVGQSIDLAQTDIHYSNGRIYVVSGGITWPKDVKEEDILLEEGAIYLFATSYSEGKNLYGIGLPPYDRELITTDTALTDEAAINLAKQNSRVQEFVQAAQELGVLNAEWDQN